MGEGVERHPNGDRDVASIVAATLSAIMISIVALVVAVGGISLIASGNWPVVMRYWLERAKTLSWLKWLPWSLAAVAVHH